MLLKSFGCSFIFGNELSDDGIVGDLGLGHPSKLPSKLTWPALLAKDLGYEYQCYARPGCGNQRILERLLNELTINDTALYVISWTWIERFDYIDPMDDSWMTISPGHRSERAEYYYKNLHGQYKDKFTTLTSVKLAIDALKEKNQPFVMTYLDELMFEDQWHVSPSILALQNYVKPYMTRFDNLDFFSWAKQNNFTLGKFGNHPLDDAHQAAFELIKSYNLV